MHRRKFLEGLGTIGALPLVGCAGESPTGDERERSASGSRSAKKPQPYNVLFIVVDQERRNRFAPSDLSLPAHESLVRRGVSFTTHYANGMPCTPSRSTLYTGCHVPNTGMFSNIGFNGQASMPTSIPTLGSLFREAGYHTAYFGKWHLSEINAGDACENNTRKALQAYGFDEYNACGDYQGTVYSGHNDDPTIAKDAVSWLGARSASGQSDPFLLCVNFVNPHDVMFFYPDTIVGGGVGAGEPDDPLYEKKWKVQLPSSYKEDLSTKPPAHQAYAKVYDLFQPYRDTVRGRWLLERYINYYYNCQADMDRQLQRVLDALAKSRFADRTIIVYTSDHGEMAAVHGLRGKGPFIYEENNHVPLVVVHPKAKPGATAALSSHVDLVPTVAALVGIDRASIVAKSKHLAGLDLSRLVFEPSSSSARSEVLMTFDFGGMVDSEGQGDALAPSADKQLRSYLRGYFDGRNKFARYFAPGDLHTPTTWNELVSRNDLEGYDLNKDPNELTNAGAKPTANRTFLESLNTKLNALIAREVGADHSSE